jgi:AcrR family transcriptional regulator
VGRWEPDAQGRLQQAALELFHERGYADVTVAEIADRAGLTKRTFFNHFADKREVLFARAGSLETAVVEFVDAVADELSPFDAALTGLTRGGSGLAGAVASAGARRELIASAPELQERDLIKMASLAAAVAATLEAHGVPPRVAGLAARTATTVFTVAWDDWVDDASADFAALVARALADLRNTLQP